MGKKGGILLALLLVIAGAGVGEAKPKTKKPEVQPKPAKVEVQKHSKSSRSWLKGFLQVVFQPLRKKPTLSSRSSLCAITGRLEETDTIWSDRPVFAWQGTAKELQLLSEETGELLWQRSLSGEEQSVAYDGPDLTPGQVYEWRVENEGLQRSTFAVMSMERRAEISADLQRLSGPAEMAVLEPDVRVALLRSQYFGEQGLWSDALQSLYGVNDPTGELSVMVDQVLAERCGVVEVDGVMEEDVVVMPQDLET